MQVEIITSVSLLIALVYGLAKLAAATAEEEYERSVNNALEWDKFCEGLRERI